ncbi:peroxisomal membrane anchor protein conserved region-domain-containing protein [Radiomyces spectabilis]|uniref:peroxisomal membrane anchor protein conserved region-domain-containing protein n=1 Tax=Radiomyces spectabilis TaxID=64574 RepID=UPI00221E869B|nr:peroxisomal membrane anchor protein conserved region-domain-containing protein [Radiomyces spectabilis]KAI8370450.1 peroxisomal membrane anchor protein conserved region-domain-containing protein [Radiomyces spectabilis]
MTDNNNSNSGNNRQGEELGNLLATQPPPPPPAAPMPAPAPAAAPTPAPTPSLPSSSVTTPPSNESVSQSTAKTPSPAPTTSTAAPATPLREDLLKSAVSFLSSPNVRSAEKSKKVAFLQKKGLNQEEISEAFKRVGDSAPAGSVLQVSAPVVAANPTAPPPRPAMPYVQQPAAPPQVVYYPMPPAPTVPTQQVMAMAVILGVGAVGVTAGLVGIVKRFISPIFNSIAGYQRDRYNDHRAIAEKMEKVLRGKKEDGESAEEEKEDGLTTLAAQQKAMMESLNKLVNQAKSRVIKNKCHEGLRDSVEELRRVISKPDNMFSYSSYTSYGSNGEAPPSVQSFKSDIRSLKGALLNRRNFPSTVAGTVTAQ